MKKELQRNVNGVMSGGGSIEHPLSIHSASIGSRWKVHGLSLMMTILLLFTMGIGQMWGADWTAEEIGNKNGGETVVGTTKGHITVVSPGITNSEIQTWVDGSTKKKNQAILIGADATSNTGTMAQVNTANSYVEISVPKGYALGTTISITGGSNNDSNKDAVVVAWAGDVAVKFDALQLITLQSKKATSAPASQNITIGSGKRTARIYRKIKADKAADANPTCFASSQTIGGGNAAIIAITATEVLAPMIEGESRMFNDETITLTGYPAGGAWAVVSGPGNVAPDGKLTANGNGTIRVSYTYNEVSGTKDIEAGATKPFMFDLTGATLPTVTGFTLTNLSASLTNSANGLSMSSNGQGIRISSETYDFTNAIVSAKASNTSKKISYNLHAEAVNVASDPEFATVGTTFVEYGKDIDSKIFTVFRSGGSTTNFNYIILTVKKAVACTAVPTVSATTKGAPTSTTQVVNCAGISSLGSEGCSISSYGFVYGTGETPNIDDDTPVEVGTTYSTINTAFDETTLTGLTPSTTYYVRAYATNGSGTAYGSAVSFTTSDACTVAPTVSAISKGTTSYTTQILNCAGITSLGSAGCAISSYGFVYGTSANPNIDDDTPVEVGTSYTVAETAFAETTLTGLTPNTTYYVRAYATNEYGTAYSSNELSFTTLETIGNVAFIASSASVTNDAITALRDAGYNVTVRTKAAEPNYTGVDLVVLDESLGWDSSSDEVGTVIGVNVPILNLKAFFYTLSNRWNWGTPVNPNPLSETATLSTVYTNIASHPIFDGVTITAGAIDMVNPSKSGNNLQGVTTSTLVEGKRGYTLATSATGTTCIHELTPAQRGVSTAKYLLIALSSNIKDNYSDDAKKMIVNAAKYLIGNTPWTPVIAPTLSSSVPANSATDVAVEGNIVLTFSENVTVLDASKFTLSGGAGSLTTASISVSGAAVTIPYTGLDNSTEYTLATAAGAVKNGSDVPNAALSNIVFTTEAACTKPEAPASLVASDIAYTSATLSWDPSGAGANGYKIALIKKDDKSVILDWTDESTNSYSATGLTQGTEYTFKVKYKGDGITPGQCEFSNEVTVDFSTTAPSVADLVTIADDYTFTPSVSIPAGTLSADSKFFAAGTGDCDISGGKMRVKTNRALAFKVADGAKIKVTFTENGSRQIQLGTALSEGNYDTYGYSTKSPYTFNVVSTGGVVYLTAQTDQLYFSKLEITYPHTVTYDLNGGTGDPTPTQASKYVGETFTAHDGITGITAPATKEFDKWVDQDAADVAGGTTYTMPAKNVILTAQWRDVTVKYAVTYDLADYTAGVAPTETDKAEGDVFAIKAAPARDGYAFMGWLCDIDAQTYQATNNYTMTAAPTTFTAVWKQEFQVTFNMKGHGDPIAAQIVLDGGKVTKPTNPSEDGWAFGGWFKETTCVNEWNFASDVVTEDTELFAKWEDETTAIKLIIDDTPSGKKINDEAYYTGSPLTSVEISEVEYPCVKLAGGATAATAPYGAGQNDNRVIAYCATTTATKIQVIAYSSSTSARPYTISFVEEGQTADQADDNNVIVNLPTDKTIHTSDWYTFNSSNNRTIYITIPGNNGDYHFLQVKVIESGTPIKKAGDLGYSMNFNIGRPIGKKQVLHSNFEGFDFYANNDYKVLQSTSMVISNATNDYIKFHAAAPMTLAVTTENANSFYVTKNAKGTANETLSTAGGTSYIDLDAAADWYISPKNGDVKITNIAFIAPKCAEPAFNSLANSDICSGDPYVALNGTATVADAGVPTYKWYAEGADESDPAAVLATTATYTPSADGKYYVIAVNHLAGFSDNTKKSDLVSVTTHSGTAITVGLAHVRKTAGEAATLTVEATGKNLHYAWKESETIDGTYTDVAGAADNKSLNILVPDGAKYYKVIVSSDCGADQESIAKVEKFVPVAQVVVANSMAWDLTTCADAQIKLDGTTSPKKGEECLMANIEGVHMDENFHSESLIMSGEYIYRTSVTGNPTCAEYMKFETSVAGLVRVHFAGNGSNRCLRITSSDNVQYSSVSTGTGDDITEQFEVAAGEIELMGMNSGHTSDKQYMRFYQIEFLALAHQRTSGYAAGDLGTVCLEDATIIDGANLYELAGLDQYGYMAFDQILSGELAAGKPYLFEVTNPSKISFYKPVGAAHSDDEIAVKGMIGTFTGTTLYQNVAQNYYYFSGRHIWRVNDFTVAIPIPAHRCYVDMDVLKNAVASSSPLPGRRRVTLGVNGKNTTTAIDNAEAADAPRKVMINGTLFILRGEKMYDATGRLVK